MRIHVLIGDGAKRSGDKSNLTGHMLPGCKEKIDHTKVLIISLYNPIIIIFLQGMKEYN